MYGLDNKVAIITGAGGKSGIGRSVATRLSEEGAKIIVTDIVENPYPEEGWNGLPSVAGHACSYTEELPAALRAKSQP